jgi:hypothetical protein
MYVGVVRTHVVILCAYYVVHLFAIVVNLSAVATLVAVDVIRSKTIYTKHNMRSAHRLNNKPML